MFQNAIKLLVLLLLIPSLLLADVQFIEKGKTAPYDGFLLPPDKANEMKVNTIERDSYKLLYESTTKSLNLQKENSDYQEEKIKLYMVQNDNLAKNLYSERNVSDWTKVAWFGIGVLASVLTLYGVKQVSK